MDRPPPTYEEAVNLPLPTVSAAVPFSVLPSAPPYEPEMDVHLPASEVRFGSKPVQSICPHCQTNITTKIVKTISIAQWVLMFAMLVLGFFLFIPWLICPCVVWLTPMNLFHLCPNCGKVVAERKFN